MSRDNGGEGCSHPNPVISLELDTVRCPDCGYSKQSTPEHVTRLDLIQKVLPRLKTLGLPGIKINDPYDAQALMCFAVCILRDAFGAKVEQIMWSSEVFYNMAKIRLGRSDEKE